MYYSSTFRQYIIYIYYIMKNNWVVFLKQKSKETGISYMCLISNKEIQTEYKNLKMKMKM